MTGLIPNRFLFTFEFSLRYRAKPPPLKGDLAGWSDAELLPRLGGLDARPEFAPVWACWNEAGVCVACHVTNKRKPLRCDPARYWEGDNLRICTDTRPSQENKRATRFCQQFFFLPTGGNPDLKSQISNRQPKPINRSASGGPIDNCHSAVAGVGKFQRAREEPPAVPANVLRVASVVEPTGYTLEAMIPAECLVGFDPAEHPRMGFYYMLEDTDHGQQFLTVGDDLLWYADPSTWALATLQRTP